MENKDENKDDDQGALQQFQKNFEFFIKGYTSNYPKSIKIKRTTRASPILLLFKVEKDFYIRPMDEVYDSRITTELENKLKLIKYEKAFCLKISKEDSDIAKIEEYMKTKNYITPVKRGENFKQHKDGMLTIVFDDKNIKISVDNQQLYRREGELFSANLQNNLWSFVKGKTGPYWMLYCCKNFYTKKSAKAEASSDDEMVHLIDENYYYLKRDRFAELNKAFLKAKSAHLLFKLLEKFYPTEMKKFNSLNDFIKDIFDFTIEQQQQQQEGFLEYNVTVLELMEKVVDEKVPDQTIPVGIPVAEGVSVQQGVSITDESYSLISDNLNILIDEPLQEDSIKEILVISETITKINWRAMFSTIWEVIMFFAGSIISSISHIAVQCCGNALMHCSSCFQGLLKISEKMGYVKTYEDMQHELDLKNEEDKKAAHKLIHGIFNFVKKAPGNSYDFVKKAPGNSKQALVSSVAATKWIWKTLNNCTEGLWNFLVDIAKGAFKMLSIFETLIRFLKSSFNMVKSIVTSPMNIPKYIMTFIDWFNTSDTNSFAVSTHVTTEMLTTSQQIYAKALDIINESHIKYPELTGRIEKLGLVINKTEGAASVVKAAEAQVLEGVLGETLGGYANKTLKHVPVVNVMMKRYTAYSNLILARGIQMGVDTFPKLTEMCVTFFEELKAFMAAPSGAATIWVKSIWNSYAMNVVKLGMSSAVANVFEFFMSIFSYLFDDLPTKIMKGTLMTSFQEWYNKPGESTLDSVKKVWNKQKQTVFAFFQQIYNLPYVKMVVDSIVSRLQFAFLKQKSQEVVTRVSQAQKDLQIYMRSKEFYQSAYDCTATYVTPCLLLLERLNFVTGIVCKVIHIADKFSSIVVFEKHNKIGLVDGEHLHMDKFGETDYNVLDEDVEFELCDMDMLFISPKDFHTNMKNSKVQRFIQTKFLSSKQLNKEKEIELNEHCVFVLARNSSYDLSFELTPFMMGNSELSDVGKMLIIKGSDIKVNNITRKHITFKNQPVNGNYKITNVSYEFDNVKIKLDDGNVYEASLSKEIKFTEETMFVLSKNEYFTNNNEATWKQTCEYENDQNNSVWKFFNRVDKSKDCDNWIPTRKCSIKNAVQRLDFENSDKTLGGQLTCSHVKQGDSLGQICFHADDDLLVIEAQNRGDILMRRDPDVIKTFRKIKEQMFLSGLRATIKSFISSEKYDVERLEFRKGVFGMIGYIYFYEVEQPDKIVIPPNNFEYEAIMSENNISIIGEYAFSDASQDRLAEKIHTQVTNTFYDEDTHTELNRIGSPIRMLHFTFSGEIMEKMNSQLNGKFKIVSNLQFKEQWEDLKDKLLDGAIGKIR